MKKIVIVVVACFSLFLTQSITCSLQDLSSEQKKQFLFMQQSLGRSIPLFLHITRDEFVAFYQEKKHDLYLYTSAELSDCAQIIIQNRSELSPSASGMPSFKRKLDDKN